MIHNRNPMATNVVLWTFAILLLASPAAPVGVALIFIGIGRSLLWGHKVNGERARRARRQERKQVDHEIKLWRSIGR